MTHSLLDFFPTIMNDIGHWTWLKEWIERVNGEVKASKVQPKIFQRESSRACRCHILRFHTENDFHDMSDDCLRPSPVEGMRSRSSPSLSSQMTVFVSSYYYIQATKTASISWVYVCLCASHSYSFTCVCVSMCFPTMITSHQNYLMSSSGESRERIVLLPLTRLESGSMKE